MGSINVKISGYLEQVVIEPAPEHFRENIGSITTLRIKRDNTDESDTTLFMHPREVRHFAEQLLRALEPAEEEPALLDSLVALSDAITTTIERLKADDNTS